MVPGMIVTMSFGKLPFADDGDSAGNERADCEGGHFAGSSIHVQGSI
jgi:hypothetical protein